MAHDRGQAARITRAKKKTAVHLARMLGRTREAAAAYRQALALAANDAERAFLEEQIVGPRPAGTA